MTSNSLYYGDNLDILRRYLPDKSVRRIAVSLPDQGVRGYLALG